MDRLVKARKPVRTSFTKTYNMLIDELTAAEPAEETLRLRLTKLERLFEELREKDEGILNLLIDDEDPGKYEAEYTAIEDYKDKMESVRLKIGTLLNSVDLTALARENSERMSLESSTTNRKKNLKPPKLELIKFTSEIKDWLNFWSQFKRIHEDNAFDAEDKFQYLIQTTEPGTRAREIIECFPPIAENYEKVVESFKKRFGREEILDEYYVRELLGLVIQNISHLNIKAKSYNLYDKLESYLRPLESME